MSKHNTASDNSDALDASIEDKWEHHGTGTGRASGNLFGALLEDAPTVAHVYPVRNGEVHFGLVVGDDTAGGESFSADITLTPDRAEELAGELLEVASAAREQNDD